MSQISRTDICDNRFYVLSDGRDYYLYSARDFDYGKCIGIYVSVKQAVTVAVRELGGPRSVERIGG